MPFQQPPHRRQRQAQLQPTADHPLAPEQSLRFILEATRLWPLAGFLPGRGELGTGDGRIAPAARSASPPRRPRAGTAPAFHRPQIPRDHRSLLTRHQRLAGLDPNPRTKRPGARRSGPHPPDITYRRHPAKIMNRHYPTTARKLSRRHHESPAIFRTGRSVAMWHQSARLIGRLPGPECNGRLTGTLRSTQQCVLSYPYHASSSSGSKMYLSALAAASVALVALLHDFSGEPQDTTESGTSAADQPTQGAGTHQTIHLTGKCNGTA